MTCCVRDYPPAVTVNGMRDHMPTLYEEASIDINGEYLKRHGARRGLGDAVICVDRGEAQDLLRHRSLLVNDTLDLMTKEDLYLRCGRRTVRRPSTGAYSPSEALPRLLTLREVTPRLSENPFYAVDSRMQRMDSDSRQRTEDLTR